MGKIGIGIPDGKIDSDASDGTTGRFENQKSITRVEFGENCTFVGDDAFENCESLTEINEDNVIEAIGTNAFAKTALTSAKFEHLTKMDLGAFYGCKELKSIIMPKVTSIPDDAFKGCTNLKDINLDKCTSIGENAFEDCKNIKQITLSNCEKIGGNAFANCKGLSRVNIKIESDTICELGNDNVFYTYDKNGDGNINENILFFILPDKIDDYKENWKTYADYMLPFVENYQIIYKTSDGIIIGSNGGSDSDSDYIFDSDGSSDSDGIIKYKNTYTKYGLIEFDADLKSLNDKIFSQKGTLTSIYLPNACERIGEKEFYNCTDLIDIVLPDDLKYIDDSAFENCVNLVDIVLPDNLKYIGDSAFAYCKAFKSFEIPETIEKLGEGIFMGCENLEEIKGNFVTDDKKSIIYDNTLIYVLPKDDRIKLNISDIDKTITKLGKGCFYGCENLTRVDIPSNITEIGDNAFAGCENLREIHFHGDVSQKLGKDIFAKINNSNLKIFVPEAKFSGYYENIQSDYLPYLRPMPENKTMIYFIDGDKMVDSSCDTKCTHDTRGEGKTITYYKTPNLNLTTISDWHYADTAVREVILAESYTEIYSGVFKNCEKLTYVYLNKVKTLGNSCFEGCTSLENITIPDSTTKIGAKVFYGCTNLKSIVIPNGVNKIESSAFSDCTSLTSITIPDSVTSIGDDAFGFCTAMKSITIPDSVTSIGDHAFNGCTPLKRVDISNLSAWCKISFGYNSANPLYYGVKLYLNGDELTDITIPSDITEIKDSAFRGCTSLKSITIPNSVISIGKEAFQSCSSLKNITIPDSITSIGGWAFSSCTSLTSITIPDSITSIGEYAFSYCESLTSVIIPNSVTSIGWKAFNNCTSLTSVTIGNGVTSIGNSAFYNCSSLISVSIPNSVASIGGWAFEGCSSLISVTIGNGVTSIGTCAFRGCIGELIINNKKIVETDYTSSNYPMNSSNGWLYLSRFEKITIGNGVTSIGSYTFLYCSSLTSVTIPDSVTSIGSYTFASCENLTSVTIPDSVTSIGYSAFESCSSLTSITIPDSVTSIGNYTFYRCTSLTSVYCKPTTPPTGGGSMFSNNAPGRKIYVPRNSVSMYRIMWSSYKSYIEGYDFTPPNTEIWYTSSNGNIITPNAIDVFDANIISNTYDGRNGIIKFDNKVTRIGDLAFYGCDNITSITIPDSVTDIGERAFASCSGITSVVIPDYVKNIGYQAFYNCSSLIDVTIGKGVTNIGDLAFYDCGNLTTFYGKFASWDYRCLIINGVLHSFAPAGLSNYTIPDNVTEIGERVFYGCGGLSGITIPDSVTKIGNLAFGNCNNLTNIIIPDSVKVIGYSAFFNCEKLATATIGSGVTEIGYYAFYNCNQLMNVYCYPAYPPTAKCAEKDAELWSAFVNNSNLKIHVPRKGSSLYKTWKYWKDYANSIRVLLEEFTVIELPKYI